MTHLPPALPPHLEGQTSTWLSKSTSARVLGNPMVWSAVTALLILIGYLWLQYYAKPLSGQPGQTRSQGELIGSAKRGGWNPDIYRPIETKSLMNITRQADDLRAENYRTEIAHQNKIQPLLVQARDYLEQEILVGEDQNNAWQHYQRVLEIEPEHRIALSGQAQIISLLQENAEYAADEEQFAEAELWLNQLDKIQSGDIFQAELRQLIVDLINENLALEQATQRKADRDKLLQTALQDASAAMQAKPPGLREAYDLYHRALELDKTNQTAIAGLKKIHAKRIAEAKKAITAGDYAFAQTLIERLQQTSAEKSATDTLLDALQAAKAIKEEPKLEANAPIDAPTAAPTSEPTAAPTPQSMPDKPENKAINSASGKTSPSSALINATPAIEATPALPPETTIHVTGRARPAVEQIKIQVPLLSRVESVPGGRVLNDNKTMLNRGVQAYYTGNYKTAFEALHPLAEKNITRAQFRIGMMYYNGRSVNKNQDLARQWIARALPAILRTAQAGQAWAQADLGTAYELGVGVIKDPGRAATWYLKSAKQGYAGAQANLGVLYGNGNGVKYDRQTALFWLKRAANQGDKSAKDNLRALNAK